MAFGERAENLVAFNNGEPLPHPTPARQLVCNLVARAIHNVKKRHKVRPSPVAKLVKKALINVKKAQKEARQAAVKDARDSKSQVRYDAECKKRERIGGYTAAPATRIMTADQVAAGECRVKLTRHKKSFKIQITAKQAGAWEKEREQASMPEPEKTLSDQWMKCGYCNKWRLLPDGSFAWPKNEWFGCDDAGVTCLTKATKRPRGNEPYPWSQPGQCWSVRRNGHNPWSH